MSRIFATLFEGHFLDVCLVLFLVLQMNIFEAHHTYLGRYLHIYAHIRIYLVFNTLKY